MAIKKRILDLLRERGPMLSMDMATILKLSKGTASQAAKELHDHGFIHIAEWRLNDKNGGNKVYAIGLGEDAVKPESNWKPRAKIEPVKKVPFVPRSANWWLINLTNSENV